MDSKKSSFIVYRAWTQDLQPPGEFKSTRQQRQGAAVCTIKDPDTVKQAMQAGIGTAIDVKLGGKATKSGGEPVTARAYVKFVSDGRYTIRSEMGRGYAFGPGPSAGLLV